ncbi:MAG: hypothetical protein ACI8WT_003709 [Clostridium sp.]|jgi:hypothetical protein
MDAKGFEDIENFYLAYKARFKEYGQINSLKDIPKVLIMHWGGIIIEAYVKYLLVKNTGSEKDRKKLWYTIEKFNDIVIQGNLPKNKYSEYSCAENPGHVIEKGVKSIDVLDDLLTDDTSIIDDIKNITYPLGKITKNGFIDLRYIAPESIEDLDDLFTIWNNSFKHLLKWLMDNTKYIGVKLDE